MDRRYVLSAFVGLFAAVSVFAAAATVKHISHQPPQLLAAASPPITPDALE
jgi:hypothetical protein